MLATLRTIGFRLAACIAFEWLAYRWFGLAGAVGAIPIFGVALARPLIDLFSEGWHLFRDATPPPPTLSFQRQRLRTAHDVDGLIYLSLADARRIVGDFGSDALFRQHYESSLLIDRDLVYVKPEALESHLAGTQSPQTWKFVLWLRNEPMLGRSS